MNNVREWTVDALDLLNQLTGRDSNYIMVMMIRLENIRDKVSAVDVFNAWMTGNQPASRWEERQFLKNRGCPFVDFLNDCEVMTAIDSGFGPSDNLPC